MWHELPAYPGLLISEDCLTVDRNYLLRLVVTLVRTSPPKMHAQYKKSISLVRLQSARERERERERLPHVHSASLAYEDGSVFMSGPFADWL